VTVDWERLALTLLGIPAVVVAILGLMLGFAAVCMWLGEHLPWTKAIGEWLVNTIGVMWALALLTIILVATGAITF
jgi:hypothetical protein